MSPQKITHNSDKAFWHGYLDFYESFFSGRQFHNIAEFGIFHGESIRWLLARFPLANIYGADILSLQPNWPMDPRVHYFEIDQSSRDQIRSFLKQQQFDLIIEDGSHLPTHQINCFIEGMKNLSPGGIYIVEDVQTSRKDHQLWTSKNFLWKFRAKRNQKQFLSQQGIHKANVLNLLLGIDHYKRIGSDFGPSVIARLSENSLFSISEITQLILQIKEVHLYKRTHLPNRCYQCGSTDFDLSTLLCICGQPIFSDADSMSFLVIKN